jgi:hypothetical protein
MKPASGSIRSSGMKAQRSTRRVRAAHERVGERLALLVDHCSRQHAARRHHDVAEVLGLARRGDAFDEQEALRPRPVLLLEVEHVHAARQDAVERELPVLAGQDLADLELGLRHRVLAGQVLHARQPLHHVEAEQADRDVRERRLLVVDRPPFEARQGRAERGVDHLAVGGAMAGIDDPAVRRDAARLGSVGRLDRRVRRCVVSGAVAAERRRRERGRGTEEPERCGGQHHDRDRDGDELSSLHGGGGLPLGRIVTARVSSSGREGNIRRHGS